MRRPSKPVFVGDIQIGGGAPIVIQSMTSTATRDIAATRDQIARLAAAGCEVARVAVPDTEAAAALAAIVRGSPLPVIADIHFDYRLALAALKAGVHGLRLNPGNIREPDRIKAVVLAAKARGVPIRVGVNAGSLPPLPALADGELPPPTHQRMVDAALWEVRLLESLDFDAIKIALKAFDVPTTIAAYRAIADQTPYPLHLGITEAGTSFAGSIRSAIGLGILLFEGIGDTIRVSLTADPVEEVAVAQEILNSLNLRQFGPTMVSCPSCGRAEIDIIGLARAVEARLKAVKRPLTVAVMGCVVNGPGEAREADVGIAGGEGKGILFRKGEQLRVVPEAELVAALMAEVERLDD